MSGAAEDEDAVLLDTEEAKAAVEQLRADAKVQAETDAAQAKLDVRGQILSGQRFVTRETNYESSLFATWERIKLKFSRYGFAHVGGRRLFNDTDGIYGGKAYLEMRTELVTFLYELAGNVKKQDLTASVRALQEFVIWVDDQDYLDQIPLLYAQAANLFHNADLGLKRPKEGTLFDLDPEKVYARWYALRKLEGPVELPTIVVKVTR